MNKKFLISCFILSHAITLCGQPPSFSNVFVGGRQTSESSSAGWTKYYIDINMSRSSAKKVALNNFSWNGMMPKFFDGILSVKNNENGKVGFIDEGGNLLQGGCKWDYDIMRMPVFGGGVALVSNNKNWYILNKNGVATKVNIGSQIHKAGNFNDDGIVALITKTPSAKNKYIDNYKRVYMNSKGVLVYKAIWSNSNGYLSQADLGTFHDGLASYYDANKGKFGYINTQGLIAIPPRYDEAGNFSEGLAVVQVSVNGARKYIYIDTKGNQPISTTFTNRPDDFHCGYAAVKKASGKYNFINKSGQVMLNEDAEAVSQFYPCGRALILKGYGKKRSGTIVDENFKVTAHFEGDIPPYDKEGLEYWSGMVYCSGGIYNAGPFIDLTDGKGYHPYDPVKHEGISRAVSQNLLYSEVGNGMSTIPTFITRIGCRVKFYIDKDEF